MRRPNYGAVTGVTGALAAVCGLRLAFQGAIPPPHANVSALGPGEFVEQAQRQDVDWKPLGPNAFHEAQRLTRPLIVVIGVPWSGIGRKADDAFATPEVARALNRGFVAVRIDGAQSPRWLSQFLPLQRAGTPLSVGFQAWIFDLKGRLIDSISRMDAKSEIDPSTMLDLLLRAQKAFADDVLSDSTPDLEASQQADAARLVQPALADLELSGAAPTLVQGLDPVWGGWSSRGLLPSRPLAFRFLQLAGRWNEAGDSLRRTLFSPCADWLDGGFYRIARADLRTPEYDKPTVMNAQLAEAMAVQDAARPDPLLRRRARAAVGWLLGLRHDDLVPGAEQGDEDEKGRSARASFAPSRLREGVASGRLTSDARAWAESALGLDGPARVVLPNAAAVDDARLDETLAALRRAAGPHRRLVATGLCDVNGTVAACLLRCARLWDDRDLAARAGAMVDALEPFARGARLRHGLNDPEDALPYLGDALAYADAELEDYLTNGRVPSLNRGAAALRAALGRFGGPEAGLLRPSPAGTELMPGRSELPQVTDDEREALSATALRLADAYASVFGPAGNDFARAADDIDTGLAAVAAAVPAMGGALGALARHADAGTLFVVGRDASTIAARLLRRLPNRLIVPVSGPVRPDLRLRPPGVYLTTAGSLSGPLSEAEALARLPVELRLGP